MRTVEALRLQNRFSIFTLARRGIALGLGRRWQI